LSAYNLLCRKFALPVEKLQLRVLPTFYPTTPLVMSIVKKQQTNGLWPRL